MRRFRLGESTHGKEVDMKPRSWWSWITILATVSLLLIVIGCGGSSSDSVKNMELMEPDYVDPAWYEAYKNDRRAAYDQFDDTILQIGVRVTTIEKNVGGAEVTGTTGAQDWYRASCKFPVAARTSLEDVRAGSYIEVKGLFDHMQETSNSYQIYLRKCVVVR